MSATTIDEPVVACGSTVDELLELDVADVDGALSLGSVSDECMASEPGGAAHPLSAVVAEAVDALVGALDGMDGWAAVEMLLAVQRQVGRLTGASARLVAAVEADGLWATAGGRSLTDWLATSAGLPSARARELVQLGRAMRDHLPATADAVLSGRVPVAQAQTLTRYAVNTEVRQVALAAPAEECGEGFLLAQAEKQTADAYRGLVRRWAAAADPAADERGYREASEREFLALSPTTGGVHLAGFFTTEHGVVLGTALGAVMTPPTAEDRRTTQQRRARALVDVAKLTLDHGLVGTGAAVRPHLTVVVDHETLCRALAGDASRGRRTDRSGGAVAGPGSALFRLEPVADVERFAVAEIVGAGPIPAPVLARLACDGEVSRLVFGPQSQVIDAGRAERVFTGPRRRAIIARDLTCRYPGCNAPPALGEIHHVDWWARDGGLTNVDDGVLLCWHHHDVVHRLDIAITRSPTGGWTFTARDGRPAEALG